jgi:hypothetical protein
MTSPQPPTVGATVHYVSYPSHGHGKKCHAAMITYVREDWESWSNWEVGLTVFHPSGLHFPWDVPYSGDTEDRPSGSWHWAEDHE